MSKLQTQKDPAKLIVSCFFKEDRWLLHALDHLVNRFGSVERRVGPLYFTMSDYQRSQAEGEMKKVMLDFRDLVPRESLASLKVRCHEIEMQLLRQAQDENVIASRPINLDPSHLFTDKFIVSSSRDKPHRLYLGHGVFGELTLMIRQGHFESLPWTYADYLEPEVLNFLSGARRRYLHSLQGALTTTEAPSSL